MPFKYGYFNIVTYQVLDERERQFKKWGSQRHNKAFWLAILVEEVGEAAKALLHDKFGGSEAGNFKSEMIQVAAVAFQILEVIIEDGKIED